MKSTLSTRTATTQLPTKLAELIRKQLLNEECDTAKRRAIRQQIITPEDNFTLCIDDSSYTASADIEHQGINTAFTRGKCTYLAHRLHELTGLPYVVWADPTTEYWTGHIAIALPNGEYLDIEGTVSNADIQSRYANLSIPEQPIIHETSDEAYASIGNIAERQKNLSPLARELINYFCAELIGEI